MKKALNVLGYPISRNKARKLMKEAGVKARQRRKYKVTTNSNHKQPVFDNLVNRKFAVAQPDQVYAADVTYIWTQEGWLYLAVVIDLCSRKVVGWSMSSRMKAKLVCDALQMAIWRRSPKAGLIHHSDRGSQYASKAFSRLLKAHQLERSMSRKGDCWDNAVAESFFGSLRFSKLSRILMSISYMNLRTYCFHLLVLLLIAGTSVAGGRSLSIDTSSPRATMHSFLTLTAETADRYETFRDSPSPVTQRAFGRAVDRAAQLFDLREVAPANRSAVANEVFVLLWEVISRQELPSLEEIPADTAIDQVADAKAEKLTHWRIPNTEITIARVREGSYSGEFRFSADTVKNARRYYEEISELSNLNPTSTPNVHRINELITGWMIPPKWVESLPAWANYSVYGQVIWKWTALLIVISLDLVIVVALYRRGRRHKLDGSFTSYLGYVSAPVAVLVVYAVSHYLFREQIHVTGLSGEFGQTLAILVYGTALVWFIWLSADQVVEIMISSPSISAESLDASLLRLISRTIGIVATVVLIFKVLSAIGVPVAGLVTGAGVGGIAIALAAKSTLENFMGALNLFADRPVRVGDLCRYDDDPTFGWRPIGKVESIGLRSTKIRHLDRSLITIPNADFAQLKIVNLDECDRMLLTTVLGLRYETTDDQLRFLLASLREMLHAHPKVIHTPGDPVRVRFVGFGDFSLNIEIRAYIRTSIRNEFLAVQEDILLRTKKLVEAAGTGFAFPSSTVYLGRDKGLDEARQHAAENQVKEWGSAQTLPFPDFTEEYIKQISGTLDYPPEGSPYADRG
jgi:MscS family membrane protein